MIQKKQAFIRKLASYYYQVFGRFNPVGISDITYRLLVYNLSASSFFSSH